MGGQKKKGVPPKQMARELGISYGYVRKVWARLPNPSTILPRPRREVIHNWQSWITGIWICATRIKMIAKITSLVRLFSKLIDKFACPHGF